MPDLLVKLYDLPGFLEQERALEAKGILIKRALAPDYGRILQFVEQTFSVGWANECRVSLNNSPVSCYIAVKDKQIVGFACYDATMKNFFGPTGVQEELRGQGIGRALLLRCLNAMYEAGYGYAVIGWVDEALPFYQKTVGATVIEGSFPGVYRQLIAMK